jgi:hypothetical protein
VNLTMDRNEIMARSNGAASTLFVNLEGGTVQFGGPVDIGYQIVTANGCGSSGSKTVSCPTGKTVLGGGCYSDRSEEELERSSPSGTTGWTCRWDVCGSGEFGSWTSYAICANVKP